ncbi:MAG: 50S ribosomal protein L35, partial [Candidatus Portiera sp.]|nr:50S ribosomal protein L35 [Portiera sp.]
QSFTSHNFSCKSTKQKRHLRSQKLLTASDAKLVKVMLVH